MDQISEQLSQEEEQLKAPRFNENTKWQLERVTR